MPADSSKAVAWMEQQEKLRLIASAEAIDLFGEHVLGDAQVLAPVGGGIYSPNDAAPGTLKASAVAEPAEISGSKITKQIGFNTIYAARQHEDLNYRHDDGEAKFLETAMKENQDKLAPFVASYVEQKMGKESK